MADQTILVNVGANISNFVNAMNEASRSASNFVSNTQKGFKAIGDVGKIVTGLGLAVAAGLGGAVKVSADFDTAIRKAGAIAGASAQEFSDMKAAALDLGATTSKSAKEVAVAMTELAAKGFDANQTIAAMPGIIKAAEASGEDLAMVSDTITSALNAFHMEAKESSKVADIMAMAANKSAAGIGDMQYAFKYAAPAAAQLGISLEELAAATGIMANAGIKGETAGTTLRMAMLRLVKPPKQAKKALESLGISVTDQNGKFKSFKQLIGELGKSMEGMTQVQKTATIGAIFGAEAMSGMMTLISNGPDNLGEFTTALEKSGGAAAKTAAQMKAGIGGALERLRGAIESLVISIGDQLVPFIIKMADFLSKVVNKFNSLSDATKKFLVIGTALAAVFALFIGPVLIIIGFIPALIEGFAAIAAMLGITSGALLGIIGVTFGWIAAIVAVGSALVIAYNECETFRNAVNAAWDWIVKATKVAAEAIKTGFGVAVDWTVQKFNDFKTIGANTFSGIVDAVSGLFGKIASVVEPVFGGLINKLVSFGGEAKTAVQNAMNLDFSGVAKIVAKFIPSLIGFLLGGIPRLIIVGMNMISAIADGMGVTVPQLMDKVVNAVTGMINTFVAQLPQFLDAGIQIIVGIINGILSQIPTFIGVITQIVNTITETLTTILPQLTDAGIQILTTLIQGIGIALPQILTAGVQVMTTLITAIVAALPTIINAGIGVLMALINGIIQALPLIIDTGITLLTSLITGILQVLPLLITAAITLVISIVTALIQMLPAIIDAGIQILMALIDGIIKVLPLLIDAAIKLVFAIVDALITNLPAIIDAGVKLIMALIDGLIKVLPMLVQATFKLITALIGAIIKMLPQILDAGVKLVRALISGLISIIGEVAKAAFKIGSKIIDEIKKIDLVQVGKNIIQGLIKGIQSMVGSVASVIKKIADSVTSGVKKALSIHSPSRVMMRLGEFTGEGFTKGIRSMISDVKSVTGDLATAALPEQSTLSLAYDTPKMGAAVIPSMASTQPPQQTAENSRPIYITNVWEVDGYEVARITEPYLDTMQADKFSLHARMGGTKR